ncbi:MAG: maltose alpha-D-glucosyltransferase [Polyangiales bacterium]
MSKNVLKSDPEWFKKAVFYEVYVRSFFDSNNDGYGDFQGLTSRLDYLEKLGVTCIWLLPFYESPERDGGYDISDYEKVQPKLGTVEDFRAFMEAAHARGIRVIADFVINHTSDQHAWFQESRIPGSPKRDWYVWSDNDQKYAETRIIFTDTEKSNWTWDEKAGAYYWHRFFSHQPDLNFDNPAVQAEILRVMRFWLDMGLDGFRLDAVPYLFEREGTNCENLPETHAYLKRLRKEVDSHYTGKVLLAEANQWPADVVDYFGDNDECQMCFHFPIMPRLYMAAQQEDCSSILDILERTPAIPKGCQWGMFLRNHDELTLEMVTDEERAFMYEAYAPDPRMRLNVGIRRRLAPLLSNSRGALEMFNAMLLSLPGSPILYYGDEIGMGDNIQLEDRDGVRTPMQWDASRNAGFSKCDPGKLYLPMLLDAVYGKERVNVEAAEADPGSLLHAMRRLLAARSKHAAFGLGTFTPVRVSNKAVFAYVREHGGETILCAHNLSGRAQSARLDLGTWKGRTPKDLLGGAAFDRVEGDGHPITFGPHGYYWFALGASA